MPVTVTGRCSGCGACLVTCPGHALRRGPVRPVLDAGRCTDCLACVEICPTGAIDTIDTIDRGALT